MKSWIVAKVALAAVLLLIGAAAVRGDSLDVTLTQASQTVAQGTLVVTFGATISNPSSTDTVFLNGDSSITSSTLVSVDDTPFLTGAPLFLTPGQSSGPLTLFNVDLPGNLAAGTYTGVFSILGGLDGVTFNTLSNSSFSVTVASNTPEPGTMLLLAVGLVGLGLIVKRA
jgi:hypothetical protein